MPGANPNRIRTSDLRSRLLNNAQTSVYQLKLTPPSSVISHLAEHHKIDASDRNGIELRCSEASLPATSFMTHEVRSDSIGVTERMAYRRIFDESIDFVFYVDRDYKVIEFFQGWIDYISGVNSITGNDNYRNSHTGYRFKFPGSYKCDSMFITKFEKDYHKATTTNRYNKGDEYNNSLEYQFIGAFPLTMSSIPLSYGPSDVLRCSIRMSYTRYVMNKTTAVLDPSAFDDNRYYN